MYADDCYSSVMMIKNITKIIISDSNNNNCKNNNLLSLASY